MHIPYKSDVIFPRSVEIDKCYHDRFAIKLSALIRDN